MTHQPLNTDHPAFTGMIEDLRDTSHVSAPAWTAAAIIYGELRGTVYTPRPFAIHALVEHQESRMKKRPPGTIKELTRQRDILLALVCLLHTPAGGDR